LNLAGETDHHAFIAEATHRAPLEKGREATVRHCAWRQMGHDRGSFIRSGPQDPPVVDG
jgi:hypothetical protein